MWTKMICPSRVAGHLTRDVEPGCRWGLSYADFEATSGLMAFGHFPSLHNLLYDACVARIPGFEIEFLA
jgi:hypothetical protein